MSELDKNRLQDAAYMAQRIAACEAEIQKGIIGQHEVCLLYTSPSPRDI